MAKLMPKLAEVRDHAAVVDWIERAIALFERDELETSDTATGSSDVPVGSLVLWAREPSAVVVTLTGPSAPAGYSAVASSEFNATYQAWKAFDGDGSTTTSLWASAAEALPATLTYTMPAPVEYVGFYMVFSADPSSPSSQSPRNFEVHGSDDGFATHDVILSVTDALAWTTAEGRNFSFTTTGPYTSYRWVFTLNHGAVAPNAAIAIQEIVLLTSTLPIPDGWLLCDGSAVPIADYSDLFGVIGTQWNDGFEFPGNFRLPDATQVVDGVTVDFLIRAT